MPPPRFLFHLPGAVCWQSCPDWEQRAAHLTGSAGISMRANVELEVGRQEPAAAGPDSGHRRKSWHRHCVLPTQCLRGSLHGWWTRIYYLSSAGNELCSLHPSVKLLSAAAVFAVGEMLLKTLLICQEGSNQAGAKSCLQQPGAAL